MQRSCCSVSTGRATLSSCLISSQRRVVVHNHSSGHWTMCRRYCRHRRSATGEDFASRSNSLFLHVPEDFGGWIVISDDDVTVSMGTLAQAVEIARQAGFGLCQPAHDHNSHRSHRINEAHAFSVARLTTFVEVGPVVLVAPEWRSSVLPMPTVYGMGPGLESDWMRLSHDGCRLGVIDAVRVSHVGIPGSEYDLDGKSASFRAEIQARGGRRGTMRTDAYMARLEEEAPLVTQAGAWIRLSGEAHMVLAVVETYESRSGLSAWVGA